MVVVGGDGAPVCCHVDVWEGGGDGGWVAEGGHFRGLWFGVAFLLDGLVLVRCWRVSGRA